MPSERNRHQWVRVESLFKPRGSSHHRSDRDNSERKRKQQMRYHKYLAFNNPDDIKWRETLRRSFSGRL